MTICRMIIAAAIIILTVTAAHAQTIRARGVLAHGRPGIVRWYVSSPVPLGAVAVWTAAQPGVSWVSPARCASRSGHVVIATAIDAQTLGVVVLGFGDDVAGDEVWCLAVAHHRPARRLVRLYSWAVAATLEGDEVPIVALPGYVSVR